MQDLHLTIPGSWNELSLDQALKCYGIILSRPNLLLAEQELVPAQRMLLFQILSGITEQQLKQWREARLETDPDDGHTVFLAELNDALQYVDFLFDRSEDDGENMDGAIRYSIALKLTRCPWPSLVRSKKGGKEKYYYAPADELENITFYELCMSFSLFEEYLSTQDDDYVHQLLAVLYRPHKPRTKDNKARAYEGDVRQPLLGYEALLKKRTKHMATLPLKTKQLLVFWFASCRQHIIDTYPALFDSEATGGGSKNAHGWGGVLMALAGELHHIDAVSAQPAHTALTYLDYVNDQNRQLKQRSEQAVPAGNP